MTNASAAHNIADYLQPGRHAHLVGIGGVSMRPLGLVLRSMGMEITGSDMNASVSTEELTASGIPVYIGHSANNIRGAECLIRTAAAHNDNPELAAARAAGIPIFERAQAWGFIMQAYRNAICVSGTHGKTTTTSMLTHIFLEAGRDPTVMIGGYLPLLKAGHRVGKGDTIILESCEYCNSFLNFFPTAAVILDVDADHLDFFKDLQDVEHSFRAFAGLVPKGGLVIANGDDANTRETLQGLDYISFGFDPKNRVYGANFSPDWSEEDVYCGGKLYAHLKLGVIGRHNAMNAVAACAVADAFGIPGETAAKALAAFHGAGRRLEYKGTYHGADVYDDYAHHPNELRATLAAVKLMNYKRVVCAFQPHTYSRTKALFSDFVSALKTVDIAVLTDIYAAREQNTIGISSRDLADEIPGSVYCPTLPEVTEYLESIAQPGDILLTVGAGDIYKAGDAMFGK
jgi:UDP-N-acetylmuramate--alanine ligase